MCFHDKDAKRRRVELFRKENSMLNEKEFYNYVERNILDYMEGEEYREVRVQRVKKNNQVSMMGLSIGKPCEHLLPILYLEPFYRNYLAGWELSEILLEIGRVYEKQRLGFTLEEDRIQNYQFIKEKVFFRLVNYEKNKDQLTECPFEKFHDLAITYRWAAYRNKDGMASAIIRNKDLAIWGISGEQVQQDARENTRKIFPPVIRKIESVIPVKVEEYHVPIFVLSNGDYMNGASAILYQEVLREFAERMNSNLYILPSSIHEVILLLEEDASDVEELSYMVRETNRTVVDQEEILSDHVYYYDRGKDEIRIAK